MGEKLGMMMPRAPPGSAHQTAIAAITGGPLAKPNYQFEKRQRDLAKKTKQEEKRRQKIAGKVDGDQPDDNPDDSPAVAPAASGTPSV